MKKIIVLGALVMGTFAFAQEQQPEGKDFFEGKKEEMKAKMAEKLSLTETQKTQVDAIDQKYAAEEEALKQQFEELRKKRQALHDKKKAEFETILTAEQKQKLEQMKAQREAKKAEKKEGKKGDAKKGKVKKK